MRLLIGILGLSLVLLGCDDTRVSIVSDDGFAVLEYSCQAPRSQLRDTTSVRAIADYTLRMARQAAANDDETQLATLTALYDGKDWPKLEELALADACSDAPLAPPVVAFPEPTFQAPSFDLARLDGTGRVRLADLRGKITVIDFWATWCLPCVQQMPEIVDLANQHVGAVTVVGIVHRERPSTTAEWLGENPPGNVIHLVDPDLDAARAYRVRGVPSTYVLDVDGRIMASRANPRVRMQLAELKAILDEQGG